jgi:hypothetical protein
VDHAAAARWRIAHHLAASPEPGVIVKVFPANAIEGEGGGVPSSQGDAGISAFVL